MHLFTSETWRWTFVVILLLVWIICTPSHFQKGGVSDNYLVIVAFFVCLISLIVNIRLRMALRLESVLFSFPFAILSMLITVLFIGPFVIDVVYEGRTWMFVETRHRLCINTIFYGLNAAILILLSKGYFSLRARLKAHVHKKISRDQV